MKITDRSIEDAKESQRRYQFGLLSAGQCLEVEVAGKTELQALRSSASHYAKRYEIQLTVRKIEDLDGDAMLYGVWLVAS